MAFSHPTKTLNLAYIALSAALMAICAWLVIPAAVPFTLQTFALFLTLGLLGGRRGTAAVAGYLLLGLIGLPVFSGFTGGFGRFIGPTGGYLTGFLLGALAYWLITRLMGVHGMIPGMLAAMAVYFTVGTCWFVIGFTSGGSSLGAILGLYVVPYLLPDLLKLALAVVIVHRVSPYIKGGDQ